MTCHNCGRITEGNAAFCTHCGAPMGTREAYCAPIVRRRIVACILLTIVTCGIYSIYWFICMVNDLNTASHSENEMSGGMVFLLSLVTCGIYRFVWYYKAGKQVTDIQNRSTGQGDSNNSLTYLLLALLGFSIVTDCLIQNELNQVAQW